MSNLYMEDLDDQALSEAASILGTTTKKDTVNAALREIARRRRRLNALDQLADMGARGDFDVLLHKENYRR
ncbi:type II toxin-antitoxin system VapB family antitoxin [Streptomyces sp. NPDC055078]